MNLPKQTLSLYICRPSTYSYSYFCIAINGFQCTLLNKHIPILLPCTITCIEFILSSSVLTQFMAIKKLEANTISMVRILRSTSPLYNYVYIYIYMYDKHICIWKVEKVVKPKPYSYVYVYIYTILHYDDGWHDGENAMTIVRTRMFSN